MRSASLRRVVWRALAASAAIVLVVLVLDLAGIDDTPTDRNSLISSFLILAAVVAGGALGEWRRSRISDSSAADLA